MTATDSRPRTLRDKLRRRLLTSMLGRIDNRRYWLRGVDVTPPQATTSSSPGPYYIPDPPRRRDIREDRDGIPLFLRIRVVDARTLAPVTAAQVEVWHCDAFGVYSGYQRYDADKFPAVASLLARRFRPTDSARFLRGQQTTDDDGTVKFDTIVPGWYTPRTPHIHARVIQDARTALTTELYFPDGFSAAVQDLPPYNRRGRSPFVNHHDIEIRLAKGSPGSWPAISDTGNGYRADSTLHVTPQSHGDRRPPSPRLSTLRATAEELREGTR